MYDKIHYNKKKKKLLHRKGNHKQKEKTTHRMGENICQQSDQQGIILQHIKTTQAAQYQKQLHQKNGQKKWTFLQRWHRDDQKAPEKMFNITN